MVAMLVGEQTHIEKSDESVHIVFGPKRGAWTRVSKILWATFFSVPLCILLGAILMRPGPAGRDIGRVIVFGGLAAWFLLQIALDLLWTLFGREELFLDEHTLTMVVRLFAYRRTRSFAVSDITGLRYDGQQKKRFGFRLPRIAFEYRGETIGTSRRITREECHAAVRQLRDRLARDGARARPAIAPHTI